VAERSARLSDLVAVGSYRTGSVAARLVPGFASRSLTAPLGLGATVLNPARRAMVSRHLQRADPSLGGAALRRAIAEVFDSSARYWMESFRLPHLSARHVDRNLTTEGYREYLLPALEAGRGAILALPHLGGWEWAGRWLADQGRPITAVVERLEPPELFEWFAKLRSDLGMNVVPLGSDATTEIVAALGRNEVVCLLSDRDLQRSGVEVEFFGETTTLPAGPAVLSLRTGAPILPTAVYFADRRSDRHLGVVRPPLDTARSDAGFRADVARVTQLVADELEVLIAKAPAQWHLFQPNWPSDPGY
jgi:KDO2-lipid IV(A) lauroyltransferase